MSGAILESWVFAEILKSYWHQGRPRAIPLSRSVQAVPVGWL